MSDAGPKMHKAKDAWKVIGETRPVDPHPHVSADAARNVCLSVHPSFRSLHWRLAEHFDVDVVVGLFQLNGIDCNVTTADLSCSKVGVVELSWMTFEIMQ